MRRGATYVVKNFNSKLLNRNDLSGAARRRER